LFANACTKKVGTREEMVGSLNHHRIVFNAGHKLQGKDWGVGKDGGGNAGFCFSSFEQEDGNRVGSCVRAPFPKKKGLRKKHNE